MFDVVGDQPPKDTQEMYEETWAEAQKRMAEVKKEQHYVFVYGSLMSGLHNDRCLKGGKLILDCAVTQKRMCMVDLGSYPGVVKALTDPSSPSSRARYRSLYSPVKGQVYKVSGDILKNSLDPLESNGSYYTRELIKIKGLEFLPDGPEDGKAWMYLLPPTYLHQKNCVTNEENVYCWRNHLLVKRAYKQQKEAESNVSK